MLLQLHFLLIGIMPDSVLLDDHRLHSNFPAMSTCHLVAKNQNTVKSFIFRSEFIAMKTAIDQIEAVHYKL